MIIDYIKTGKDAGLDWNYVLTKDVTINFGTKYKVDSEFKNEWCWIRMQGYELVMTVFKDYAWDGCSVVPDLKGTLEASLPHDVLYQFEQEIKKVWKCSTMKVLHLADNLFLLIMKKEGVCSFIRYSYYSGVVILGGPYHYLNALFHSWFT